MARISKIYLCLLLCLALALPVFAQEQVTKYQNMSTLDDEGGCQVSLYVTLRLEEPAEELYFPLPAGAGSVRLNGSSVSAKLSNGVRRVDLLRYGIGSAAGEYSLNFQYSLSSLAAWTEDEKLMLTLPLMSGFGYETSAMEFTVTLPGEITARPSFTSGYFGSSIESYLSFVIRDNTISGRATAALKDHETLTMTLELDPSLFPSIRYREPSALGLGQIGAIACGLLALLYWLLTLRCGPVFGQRNSAPIEGATAGDLGSRLTMVGTDLTMMVLTWAQLGYVLIQMDDNGRVLLHRRMNMGNERNTFENRVFDKLFPKKKYMVDGTGYHYAKLCRYVAKQPLKTQGLFQRRSGNPRLFRILCTGAGLFGGIAIATSFTDSGVLATGLAVVLALFGAVTAWTIQSAMHQIHLHDRTTGRIALILGAVWLVLGAWSGAAVTALPVLLVQLQGGLAAAYGGRRSELGRQQMQDILGLRRHLKTVPREELQRIQRVNPDYFFEMLPFAMALGVEKSFARQFGGTRLPECSYLTTRMGTSMTAWEWVGLFRDAVDALDERQKQLPLEKLLGK